MKVIAPGQDGYQHEFYDIVADWTAATAEGMKVKMEEEFLREMYESTLRT